ncbi:putative ashwin protein [Danaus plexippus plexippus]|uniref:Ashwin protein n=1 Tax=Danaus plexippus plexippus TaxID=278856 RepID=A0A212F6Z4_DANPL|nr:putative ashwin protein [Danaus plexippus plexippus]
MLLHPELLPNEKLIQIIHERHLRIPNLSNMSRPELLGLFHQFCLPYGQRRYRDSGRGKILNKCRQLSPDRTVTMAISDKQRNSLTCSQVSDNGLNKISHRSNEDRPEPAPDVLSGQIKRIKIDRSTPNGSGAKRKSNVDPVSCVIDDYRTNSMLINVYVMDLNNCCRKF